MGIPFWFWLGMFIWLVWGGILGWRGATPDNHYYWGLGWNFWLWLLLAMLGYAQFGSAWKALVG